MKRKIAVILAADIAGYSRLVAEDEEEALRRLRDYKSVFQELIASAGGRIFNTAGDSVLAEFPSAVDALRCAVSVQESLRIRNNAYPLSRQMAYRMGLTIGDVVEEGSDLLGDGVNIAARLEALAQPGGICISKSLHDAVANKLSVRYVDMGSHQVKNIPMPVHVYSVASGTNASTAAAEKSAGGKPGSSWRASTALMAVAAALAGAALMSAIAPKLFGTPDTKVAATPSPHASSPAAVQGAAAPSDPSPPSSNSAPAQGTPPPAKSEQAAVAPPPAATDAQTDSKPDPAAELRLRAGRWTACSTGDTDAALLACKALIDGKVLAGDDLAIAHHKLGLALRKSGNHAGALSELDQSIAIKSTAVALNDRGIIHVLQGDFAKAITDYDAALKQDASNAEVLNNRAWSYYKTGRTKDALADADKSVAALPDKAYVWDTRGHIHEALGDRKSAIADFMKAITIDTSLKSSKDALRRLKGE